MLPSVVQRAIAAGLLLAYVPGCTSWRVQSVPAAQLVTDHSPARVRADHQDGSRLTISNPRLSGDSIVGLVKGDTTGIPLDAVGRVAVQRLDPAKTVGLVGLIIGGAVAVWWATFTYSLGTPCSSSDCEEEEY